MISDKPASENSLDYYFYPNKPPRFAALCSHHRSGLLCGWVNQMHC